MYTLDYEQDTLAFSTAKDEKIRRAKFAMDLYAVADKYQITRMIPPAAEDFRTVFGYTTDADSLEAIIRAHYDIHTQCGHAIGELIASTLFEKHHSFRQSDEFPPLLRSIPGFASDVALFAHQKGMFKRGYY